MGISNMETTSRRFSGTCVLFLIAWFIFFGNEHNVWSKSYTFVATMLSLPDVYVWTLVCNVVHTHVWHREEVKNIEHRCADETNFDHCVDMNLESLQSGAAAAMPARPSNRVFGCLCFSQHFISDLYKRHEKTFTFLSGSLSYMVMFFLSVVIMAVTFASDFLASPQTNATAAEGKSHFWFTICGFLHVMMVMLGCCLPFVVPYWVAILGQISIVLAT